MTNTSRRYEMVLAPSSGKKAKYLLVKRGAGENTYYAIAVFYSEGSCKIAVEALNATREGQYV